MKDTLIFALLAKQIIAIVVVSCGITSFLSPNGKIAHSRFMTLINFNDGFSYNINMNYNLGELLQNALPII